MNFVLISPIIQKTSSYINVKGATIHNRFLSRLDERIFIMKIN